ncbi:hypothetical protein HS088_TW11G00502 [Tripterygium wilfordii]|uniref:CCT domain-containing protein n=1 Tax=Tripterygium wilfordii TaxID=458696 RepID=A0A7J7D289_TRIWF|nr:zinc finger protein CONSTANS-LIKE 8-like [Tripterygium wilfordii]KAF5740433.1 hypothetical protein HS088_TW11G00502 [Tripterygium wilfordii]
MKATKKTRKSTARNTGAKNRKKKPKYLSLRLQLSQQTHSPLRPARVTRQRHKQEQKQRRLQQQQQIPLFVEDMHDDHVAMLFDTSTNSTAASLQGILENSTSAPSTTEREEPLSPYACAEEGSRLVRTAMRCKERDASEEKWVCYAEVVEEVKKEQEEVSSCCCATTDDHHLHHDDDGSWLKGIDHQRSSGGGSTTSLVLKLDYQHILNAWSDKGPLFVDEQVVPDLHDPNHGSTECLGSVGNIWSVPEVGSTKPKEESGTKEGWKVAQREASILRYKEKRQNRLFSKRIRYEVRKLNADKRPRIKGRFVKRTGED